jgi:hypothetical protein
MADETSTQQQLPLEPKTDESAAKIAKLEADIARTGQTMEQRLAQMQQQLQQGRPPVATTGGDDQKINEQLWSMLQNDPKQLLNAQQAMTHRAMQAYDAQQRQQRFPADKAAARNSVREEAGFEEVFKKYSTDIEQKISKVWPDNPAAFVSPEAWRIAAEAVRGEKWKDLMPRENETDPGAPGKPSPKPLSAGKDKDEALSEAETYAAETVFGIDKSEYGKYKKINKEQRDQKTWSGRAMLQSPLAKMTYKDMNKTVSGFPNPHYGKMRPYMTFDSNVQKPRHPRDGE